MLETIDYIRTKTGNYDNIAIGSDFDGLADEPEDLYKPSQFVNLIRAPKGFRNFARQYKSDDQWQCVTCIGEGVVAC